MMAVRLLLLVPLAAASKMTLVETIPLLDLDEIQLTPGAVNTWEAQVALANGAKKTLDVTFMYENLLAESDAPHASSFSRDLTALGVDRGRLVFEAVVAAQRRGVAVRVLASPMGGTANCSLVRALRGTPAKFAYAEWDPDAWYGGGIMRGRKRVIQRRFNVKEFGVLVEDGAVGEISARSSGLGPWRR
ncbi:N-acylphosphatidylethanolamine-specific phospholipase D [Aureococcus anophagefferens]|nr:N-acylphosphatidylethanolamine-specific phospholipase D [Aureococcus anophagefferens]